MNYLDLSCILRLYVEDPGWQPVRRMAAQAPVACSIHGQAEVIAALHRKVSRWNLTRSAFAHVLDQFETDCDNQAYRWLQISPTVIDRVAGIYLKLPSSAFLRASDALHLTSVFENRFREIYSNDLRLIGAAEHFALKGVNILT